MNEKQYIVKCRYKRGKCVYDCNITVDAPTEAGAISQAKITFAQENCCKRGDIRVLDVKAV